MNLAPAQRDYDRVVADWQRSISPAVGDRHEPGPSALTPGATARLASKARRS
jgi:hypothetical protein